MRKEQAKKLTLKDLIAKKEQILNNKVKTMDLYVKSLDAVITIQKPDIDTIIDASKIDNPSESDRYLVYNCVIQPNLKDKELQEAYGCVEPIEILKIFEDGEISSIALKCMELAGYRNSVSVVEDIKN
ncbi:Phage XkdN-like tail assembly chaperone protein, TAC [Caloramator quimbayensis]|uniref:Phage XkdN-like tail assembly chaperone protein, TAC n=1 Tax=Caloramator quimbayensis TaxID=1147123 RepID=A0A1T4YBX1_9CLOT|nr:hypothetical protein [Caloramator quimbayensis]SKA99337.1 Phage XkdN-like tail assembly chaperone protein, TAC [Caloramator quimbayensis]